MNLNRSNFQINTCFPVAITRIILVVVLCMIGFSSIHAQDYDRIREELRLRQQQTNREIQSLMQLILGYEQQIRESDTRYESLYREFQALEREINIRDNMINNLQAKGRQIGQEINVLQGEFTQNQRELERLIKNYKESLKYLYKHGRVPEIAYLFSSGSFNQMMVRSYYLRKFEEHRTSQAKQIEDVQQDLKRKEEELQAAREDIQKNVEEVRQARAVLNDTRRRQNQNIAQLQQNRRQMQDKLSQTRRDVENFNRQLNETIAQLDRIQREEEERIRVLEAERLRRLAAAQNIEDVAERAREVERFSTPVTRPSSIPSRDAMASLEASFASSRGKLNWPVANGVITAPFGDIVHPVYRTRVPNPGIEISTDSRSAVMATHDGYVSLIGFAADFDRFVMINHGKYKTIYANLSEVLVATDSYVRAGDIIARSGSENSSKGTTLVFIIKEGTDSLDPAQWILPRQQAQTRP
jgi:septal ring factor EnvC (AmiA/AmiB activator)